MREPTAASHFTRNMFQSLAEEFLFDYLPDIIFSFVSHPPDIRYIQIYIFDTNLICIAKRIPQTTDSAAAETQLL